MTPTCMTPDELALWHDANARLVEPAVSPCLDCQPEWCVAMRAVGACNGTPGIPVTRERPRMSKTDRRRESNRLAARRFRERHPGRRAA